MICVCTCKCRVCMQCAWSSQDCFVVSVLSFHQGSNSGCQASAASAGHTDHLIGKNLFLIPTPPGLL